MISNHMVTVRIYYPIGYKLRRPRMISSPWVILATSVFMIVKPYGHSENWFIADRSLYRHAVSRKVNGDRNQLGAWRYSDPKAN